MLCLIYGKQKSCLWWLALTLCTHIWLLCSRCRPTFLHDNRHILTGDSRLQWTMWTADFISEYIPLDISRQSIPTSQHKFYARASFFSFDFGGNFPLKGCLHHSFVIRLEPLLLIVKFIHTYIHTYIRTYISTCLRTQFLTTFYVYFW